MSFIRPFSELSKADAGIAGGKGASLGEMTQAGIPVPPGFVVLTTAFDQFMTDSGLSKNVQSVLDAVDGEDVHSLLAASKALEDMIMAAAMPKSVQVEIMSAWKELGAEFVAIRSSATAEDGMNAAWAGQLDTYLNTREDEVLWNVQRCWASLYTPRAIHYRLGKGMGKEPLSVAVVIQKMIQSEVSGVAFSVDPLSKNHNRLIIEASYGLGEAVVSGQVTPDSYVVTKESREIVSKTIATKSRGLFKSATGGIDWREVPSEQRNEQALSDEDIFSLSEVIVTIERHFGFPSDIEWALEGGILSITQSRPITTLTNESFTPELREADYQLTFEGTGLSVVYECIMLQEYVPYPSLSLNRGGITKEYLSRSALPQMAHEGSTRSLEDIRTQMKALEDIVPVAKLRFAEVDVRDPQTVEAALAAAKEVARAYGYFDTFYWEGAYQKAKESKAFQSIITEIEAYRNVACVFYNQFFFGTEGLIPLLIEHIATAHTRTVDELMLYTDTELLELVSTSKRVSNEEVLHRTNAYILVRANSGQVSLESGEKAHATIDRFLVTHTPDSAALKGTTAHGSSVVSGPAFVYKRDYASLTHTDMPAGHILITETVDPSMLTMFRTASAVVTVMGGMLSHAAIMARELNIPCIVGVPDATNFYRTGESIVLNLEHGTVQRSN